MHFNVLIHFLWEGPTEPRHPSLCTAAVAWTTSITIPQWVFKVHSVFIYTGVSRFTKIIQTNKGRRTFTRVLGAGTVVDTIAMIVIIRESRGICPNMSTRVPKCDGDTIDIVGVDVICGRLESISGVVLVAPSLSSDLAVTNAVNRVCNTRASWCCVSSTQLGRCVDLSERGGTAGSRFSHVEVRHSHPPSPDVAVGGVHVTVDLSALHGGTLQPVVA